jgi:cytochrome bd-type quinol oxidase subunit 1
LIGTWAYVLVFDAMAHLNMLHDTSVPKNLLTVSGIGVVSGVIIEFIAGINFCLYSRASKQVGAFHICLERTHRYLIAYKDLRRDDGKGG